LRVAAAVLHSFTPARTMSSYSAVIETRRGPGSRLLVLLIGLVLDRSAAVGVLPLAGSSASPELGNPLSTPSYLSQDELHIAFLDTLLEAIIDGDDGDAGLADELKNSLIDKVTKQFHAEHLENPHMKQPWMDGIIDDVFKQMHTMPSQPEYTHRETPSSVSGDAQSARPRPKAPVVDRAPDVVSSESTAVPMAAAAAAGGAAAVLTLGLAFGVRVARRRAGQVGFRREVHLEASGSASDPERGQPAHSALDTVGAMSK